MFDLTNPQILGDLLKKHHIWTDKTLGQNFLIDRKALEKIVLAAEVSENDVIVEVGPGPGVLTHELLALGGRVEAVELDDRILPVLAETTAEWKKNLTVYNQSVLEFFPSQSSYKLVANIPYYLTSPILHHFLEMKKKPEVMVLLVQKEVAEKICCKPSDETILSLLVKLWGVPEIVSIVQRNSFFPAPKVDSAILRIVPRKTPQIPVELHETFWRVAKGVFLQRRKKIGNTLTYVLKKSGEETRQILESCNISPDLRPQTITFEQWNALCKAIS